MLKQRLTGLMAIALGIASIAITGDGTLSVLLFIVGGGALFGKKLPGFE